MLLACLCLFAPSGATARQAAIVVDGHSGETLFEQNADAARFPASITKVMTLFILFEEIERGRYSMSSRLAVSANAARQPPTRLGLRAGGEVSVQDAIMALITRSANDIAVVVAENIAGSEEAFAERMTQRARQIGMTRTVFRNASGLPNMEQRTTARDLALLGRAIYERFPQHAHFFARQSFRYGRQNVRNHNRLLGRVQYVDGIKTGYTRASGFNILTSARGGGRHMIVVVMGGRSAGARDAQVAALVRRHYSSLATRRTDSRFVDRIRSLRGGAAYAQRREAPPAQVQAAVQPPAPPPQPPARAVEAPERPRAAAVPVPPPVPADPAPVQVQTQAQLHGAIPAPAPRPQTETRRDPRPAGPVLQWRTGAQPVTQAGTGVVTTASVPERRTDAPPPVPQSEPAASGWVIQIAAAPTETEAQRMLDEARQSMGRRFNTVRPVTERVQRGSSTLYRARFAGFADRAAAEAACTALRRNEYECMAIRL